MDRRYCVEDLGEPRVSEPDHVFVGHTDDEVVHAVVVDVSRAIAGGGTRHRGRQDGDTRDERGNGGAGRHVRQA